MEITQKIISGIVATPDTNVQLITGIVTTIQIVYLDWDVEVTTVRQSQVLLVVMTAVKVSSEYTACVHHIE